MAITATLTKAKEYKNYWKMEIQYNDDGDIVYETFRFNGSTIKSLKDHAMSKVVKYEEIKSFDFTTLIGESIDVTPVEPTIPTPPTLEEVARRQWFEDYNQLKQVNILLEQAPAISTASRIEFRDSLQLKVETNWLDSYLGEL